MSETQIQTPPYKKYIHLQQQELPAAASIQTKSIITRIKIEQPDGGRTSAAGKSNTAIAALCCDKRRGKGSRERKRGRGDGKSRVGDAITDSLHGAGLALSKSACD